ncbi:uncharacterized protein TrAtP1_001753 [Trichoderma atroviride]|uniref:uncharacterized protein n=1 Tax=Hypocrea atroviridis TaxID=63577 RepID=UPI0033210769|nr:hypothetical protein TrAtP1_001753 [Trichoderma atroviride]
MAGLEIREAGSRIRPTSSLFDMNQNPMSPVASSKRSRQSMDTFVSRSNRGSYVSMRTIRSQVTDAGTQTDTGNTPETSPSPGLSGGSGRASPAYIPVVKEEDEEEMEQEEEEEEEEEVVIPPRSANRLSKDVAVGPDAVDEDELSQGDTESLSESLRREEDALSHGESSEEDELFEDEDEDDESDEEFNDADDEDDIEEEPVVFEVAAVQRTSTQMRSSGMIQARGNVVTIAKRVPPPLPTRSPARMSRIAKKDADGEGIDLQSPLSQIFSSDGDLDSQDADAKSIIEAGITKEEEQQPEIEHSESEKSDAAEPQHQAVAQEDEASEASEVEEPSADEIGLETGKQDDALLSEPHNEQADNSDAASNKKKHTSSIYTGVTEDRWSCDGSSVTTPTSERRFSITENQITDDTTKKTIQERVEEIDDSPSAPTEAAHTPVAAAN